MENRNVVSTMTMPVKFIAPSGKWLKADLLVYKDSRLQALKYITRYSILKVAGCDVQNMYKTAKLREINGTWIHTQSKFQDSIEVIVSEELNIEWLVENRSVQSIIFNSNKPKI